MNVAISGTKKRDYNTFYSVLFSAQKSRTHTLINYYRILYRHWYTHGWGMDQCAIIFSCTDEEAGAYRLFATIVIDDVLLYTFLQLIAKIFGNGKIISTIH